jgi:ribosomal protein L37E
MVRIVYLGSTHITVALCRRSTGTFVYASTDTLLSHCGFARLKAMRKCHVDWLLPSTLNTMPCELPKIRCDKISHL